MSHKQNTEWIEAAHENFEEAISNGDVVLAQSIIADTRDAGFREEAEKMVETMAELPVAQTDEKYE